MKSSNLKKKKNSVKNSKFDKYGYIHIYFKKTVKDINFCFLVTDRILRKLKIKKKINRISLIGTEIC